MRLAITLIPLCLLDGRTCHRPARVHQRLGTSAALKILCSDLGRLCRQASTPGWTLHSLYDGCLADHASRALLGGRFSTTESARSPGEMQPGFGECFGAEDFPRTENHRDDMYTVDTEEGSPHQRPLHGRFVYRMQKQEKAYLFAALL